MLSFDTDARVLVSPTSDHAPVLAGVNSLTIGGGTATGVAINTARSTDRRAAARRERQKAPAAIVLMSDGSPTIGDERPVARGHASPQAVAAAKTAQVPIDTIAFGTADGTVNDQGETIPVPADPQAMAKIASGSGGKSFTATTGNELNSVYDQIRKSVGYDTVTPDITEWFLGLALLLAVLTAGAALVLDATHPVDAAKLGNAERSRTAVHAGVRRLHDRRDGRWSGGVRGRGAAAPRRPRRAGVVPRSSCAGQDAALPFEVHLLWFPNRAAFDAYLADDRRRALLAEFGEVFTVKQVVELDTITALGVSREISE